LLDVPVTVTVAVPVAAVALAVRVKVLEVVAGFGLKLAVTPAGSPEADIVTFPLKPLIGLIVIVLEPLLACTTVNEVGFEDNEKFFADGLTVKLIGIVSVKVPEVPMIFTRAVPVAAVVLAVNVNVVAEVVPFGLKETVTPLGNPEAEKETVPLKPVDAAMLMSVVVLLPWRTVRLLGLAERVKTAGQFVTRL
jgi:hypothetical protein